MDKIDKVYFTSGVSNNVFNDKVFGICCILQEKINELVGGYNEIMKWRDRQNKISKMLMQKVYEIDFDKIMMKIDNDK